MLTPLLDFETMEVKLESNQYPTLETFTADAQLVFNNCRTYNAEGSNYVKNANKLEKYLKERQKVRCSRPCSARELEGLRRSAKPMLTSCNCITGLYGIKL